MRFTELICLSVFLAVFSTMFASSLSQLRKLDRELEFVRNKTESMIFISSSFKESCRGKGFSSFEEWSRGCKALWQLKSIEWNRFDTSKETIYYGAWSGVYGNGRVFAKKGEKENESKY